MRIGIQAWGSEGDIRPFLALGHGLVRAGHRVTVVVTDLGARDYAAYQERLGLRIRTVATPVVPDPAELDDIGRAILRAGHPARQSRIIIERLFDPAVPEMYRAATALCAETDLVVGHFFQTPLRAAAEAAGIPEVSVTLTPSMIPTGAMPPEGVPDLGRRWNRTWWGVAAWVLDRMFLSRINRFRAEAGLPPHTHVLDAWSSRLLDLVAVSPTLCPVPEDWPEQHRVCGFLTLPPDGQLDASPPALEAFLDEGDPPAFITFGSLTPSEEAERFDALRIFTEAVSRA
ncbi:MAG: glycosyltransferase, partial [Gemmatimonadota bacterium]